MLSSPPMARKYEDMRMDLILERSGSRITSKFLGSLRSPDRYLWRLYLRRCPSTGRDFRGWRGRTCSLSFLALPPDQNHKKGHITNPPGNRTFGRVQRLHPTPVTPIPYNITYRITSHRDLNPHYRSYPQIRLFSRLHMGHNLYL